MQSNVYTAIGEFIPVICQAADSNKDTITQANKQAS